MLVGTPGVHRVLITPTVVRMTALLATSSADPGHANQRPPRDGLVRLWSPGTSDGSALAIRENTGTGKGTPLLFGHFAVWNRWTEIDSFFEGNFMERLAPGCMKKTIKDQRDAIRVLFQHGRDQTLGFKPLGAIDVLREDEEGAYYEVPLFRGIPEIIMDGLRENQYGASFKFRVIRETIRSDAKVSAENPKGLDERTIEELQLFEFGPVTFPAYQGATAGLRSLTDDYILDGMAHADPELVRMAASGVDLAGLIARRAGLTAARPVSSARSGGRPGESETTVGNESNASGPYEVREVEVDSAVPHGVYDEAGLLVAAFASPEAARAYAGALPAVTRDEGEEDVPKETPAAASTNEETRDSTPDAGATRETDEAPDNDSSNEGAAPVQGTTPLIGPEGYRESWRL